MQITAEKMIKRAMRLLGLISSGDDPTPEEFSDGFDSLVSMINQWATNPLMSSEDAEKTFTGAQAIVTVGDNGDIDVLQRPAFITYISWNGRGLDIALSREEFSSVSGLSIPKKAYYERKVPLSEVLLAPAPTESGVLVIGYRVPMVQFDDLTTPVEVSDGADKMIAYNLAVEIAPEFQVSPSSAVMAGAVNSIADFKRMNYTTPIARLPNEIASLGNDSFDIWSGE